MPAALLVSTLTLAAAGQSAMPPPGELPVGEVIEAVEIREDPSLSYALYLPRAYEPGRARPILYLLDARGRALVPLEVFREAAEAYGYILASSYDTASDDAVDTDIEVIRALWRDTHDRFRVDWQRVYMAGFSGLARVACLMADQVPGAVSGVIACGAGFSPARPPREGMEFLLFGIAGSTDFNHDEMVRLDARLDELGAVHHIEVFDGGHHWPPATVAREAIEWMELHAMRAGTRPKDPQLVESLYAARLDEAGEAEATSRVHDAQRRYRALSRDFAGLRDVTEVERKASSLETSKALREWREKQERRLVRDERYLKQAAAAFARASADDPGALVRLLRELKIPTLKRRAREDDDLEERLSARRSLESVFVQTGYYLPRHLLETGDDERAVLSLSVAVEIKPESPLVWFTLARAQARTGREGKAVESLERAIEAGFSDAALLEEQADLEALRDEEGFRGLLETLRRSRGEQRP
jgi:tetratricopeptide (TPR) repeat protein